MVLVANVRTIEAATRPPELAKDNLSYDIGVVYHLYGYIMQSYPNSNLKGRNLHEPPQAKFCN